MPARTRELVDAVANWRNIFRQLGKYFFLTGEKKLGNYTKALSTSCESTFIGLRKYIQWLMKVLSKIRCPCLHEITTYSDCPPPLFLITLHPKKNE